MAARFKHESLSVCVCVYVCVSVCLCVCVCLVCMFRVLLVNLRSRTRQTRMSDDLVPMQTRDAFDMQLLIEAATHCDRIRLLQVCVCVYMCVCVCA